MRVQELDTPAIIIDLDIMERNLRRVATYCAEHRLRLRPHTKTHKSTFLARQQLALGAAGLTVAKVGEAEVMAGAEPRDLLIAFPVIGEPKLRRLAEVARLVPVTVALDSITAARLLSEGAKAAGVEFGVLIEIDVGLGRVGVRPHEAVDLAREVAALPSLRLRGVTFYPGHIKNQNENEIAQLSATISSVRDEFERAGLEAEIISGGSTPLLFRSHEIECLNEIRPGTYLFNDVNTVASGGCKLEDCAASLLVTIVSHTRRDRMIVDGGSKTFSSDRDSSGGGSFGRLIEAPEAAFHRMNEEHGFIDLSGVAKTFEIGDKTRIIPNHICVAVNLHEFVYGVRGENVEEVWKVEARGQSAVVIARAPMFSLKSKIALVTGAGRGIGRAVAEQLAAAGATVMLNDLDRGPLEEAQRAIAGSAQQAGDLTDSSFPEQLVGRTIAELGGLDIIVNNAGYTWDNIIQKTTDEQFQAMLDIHVVAPFRILRAAAPWIRDTAKRELAEGRRIHRKVVNITSISATDGGAGQAGYSAGKAAVIGLTRTMAKEWGRYSVNINAVGFGLIETRLIQPLTTESKIQVKGHEIRVGVQPGLLDKVISTSPLGRAGTVEEAAGAVVFFCSPLSDFVTGEVLMCSGGMRF